MDARGHVFEPPTGATHAAQAKLIHLSRPGAEREGPYTVEQINAALAAGQYQGSEYWAWYQGLDQWIPLYSVPGIQPEGFVEPPAPYDAEVMGAQSAAPAVVPAEEAQATYSPVAQTPPAQNANLGSGLPFTALEQIFILSTGEAQTASRSSVAISLLQEVIGEDWATIRSVVPRDAIGKCLMLSEMAKGSIPGLVWRAMTAFKPALLRQAREGLHRICIRTFSIETGDTVSVFLFYNKEKLG